MWAQIYFLEFIWLFSSNKGKKNPLVLYSYCILKMLKDQILLREVCFQRDMFVSHGKISSCSGTISFYYIHASFSAKCSSTFKLSPVLPCCVDKKNVLHE